MSTDTDPTAAGSVAVGMPRLSDSMQQGTIERWLVADGAAVTRGQEILEVETDKAVMAYEAESDGLLHILAPAGATVAVGDPIATIGSAAHPDVAPGPEPVDGRPHPPDRVRPVRRPGVSPLLRRIAAERGVDLHHVVGTGRDGTITREDILQVAPAPEAPAAEAPAAQEITPDAVPAPPDLTRQPLTRGQRRVAERLGEAKRTIPDFWASVVVDVTAALALRDDLRALAPGSADADEPDPPATPTLNDLVLKATALALRAHPRLNAFYDDDHIVLVDPIDLGMAVATDDGLLVPVLRAADRLPLAELAAQTRALARSARQRRIDLAHLERGTFTVSNLGGFGIRRFAPIINGRQAAILGIGAATPTCVPRDGRIEVRSLLEATLTCDHRIVYGTDAAAFLQTFTRLLERPVSLLG